MPGVSWNDVVVRSTRVMGEGTYLQSSGGREEKKIRTRDLAGAAPGELLVGSWQLVRLPSVGVSLSVNFARLTWSSLPTGCVRFVAQRKTRIDPRVPRV